jgi:branched-chain amino acid transport system substrate-binding protein
MMAAIRVWLRLIAIVGLTLALAGCGSPSPEPTADTSEDPAPTEATEESQPTESTSDEEAEEAEAEETESEDTEGEEADAGDVLKVGILAPYSGPAALSGKEFRGSAEIAFDNIDWQIGSYEIKPVWIDSQSDPAKASQAYEQAVVQDDIQVAILNWHSSVSVACMEVAAKHKIPHLAAFGATEVVNETFHSDPEKYGYWTSKWWATPTKLTQGYIEALEEAISSGRWNPESKTVALYGEDTDWGRSFANALRGQLEEVGWEVVDEEYFPGDQVEFYPYINKLNNLNPALLAGTHTGAAAFAGLLTQADELELEAMIIADGLGRFGEWYELTGNSSNYVLDQITPAFRGPEGEEYVQKFEDRYGFTPSASAGGLAYDGTGFFIAIAQAVYEETGELSSEAIYDFIQNKLWTGEWSYTDGIVMEEYAFTQDSIPDPVVGAGYYVFPIVQYVEGEAYTVYPPAQADQELTAGQ